MAETNRSGSSSKPKTITVLAKKTVNLGDYNSATYEASVEVEVNDESVLDVYDKAWTLVTREVAKRIIEETGEV